MNALLITGTDAGVGKTWVGRALAAALTAAGRRVRWRVRAAIDAATGDQRGDDESDETDDDGMLAGWRHGNLRWTGHGQRAPTSLRSAATTTR